MQAVVMEKSVTNQDLFWIVLMAFLLRDSDNKLVSANKFANCPPAEEGQPYNLTFTWNTIHNKKHQQVIVENVNSLISTCDIEGNRCYDIYRGDLAKTVLYVSEETGVASLTVTLGNVSENKQFNAEGKWTLKFGSFEPPFMNCTLDIVAKAPILDCKTGGNKYAICVTCSVPKHVHRSKCVFVSKSKELNLAKAENRMFYESAKQQDKSQLPLLTSRCTLKFPVSQLGPGKHHLVVIIYPEINGDDRDLKSGTKQSIIINQDNSRIIDCHPVRDTATNVLCTCERPGNPLIQTTLTWIDNNNSLLIENGNFNYSSIIETKDDEVAVQNIILFLGFVLGGNLLIIAIIVAVLRYNKKASNDLVESCFPCQQEMTKHSNDYDAINGGYLLVDYSATGNSHQYGTTRILPNTIINSIVDDCPIQEENHYETIENVGDVEARICDCCHVEGNIPIETYETIDKDVE